MYGPEVKFGCQSSDAGHLVCLRQGLSLVWRLLIRLLLTGQQDPHQILLSVSPKHCDFRGMPPYLASYMSVENADSGPPSCVTSMGTIELFPTHSPNLRQAILDKVKVSDSLAANSNKIKVQAQNIPL